MAVAVYLAVLTKAANVLDLHIPKSEGLTLARERQIMRIMKTATLDPIVSEFETQEHSNAYDIWFKAKVQEAMDSKKPRIPHDEVVKLMQERLALLQKTA